jgi:hypothetical protein
MLLRGLANKHEGVGGRWTNKHEGVGNFVYMFGACSWGAMSEQESCNGSM